jgi:hypothetical protein
MLADPATWTASDDVCLMKPLHDRAASFELACDCMIRQMAMKPAARALLAIGIFAIDIPTRFSTAFRPRTEKVGFPCRFALRTGKAGHNPGLASPIPSHNMYSVLLLRPPKNTISD